MDWELLGPVIERYKGMIDLFLICVDRDGNTTRRAALDNIETQADKIAPGCIVLAENAWQEIEVWVLAGHDLPSNWVWRDIRAEVNPKEAYFEPFATQQGVHQSPGGGRKALAQQAARRYNRIRRLCPEDVAALEARIRDWIERKT